LLIGLLTVFILNAMELRLILAFPLGLAMFFAHIFWTAKDFPMSALAPFVIAAYGLYVVLCVAVFVARKWSILGIICFILACVILMNAAGCRQIANGIR
jgi:hypothetical protein